MDYKLIASDLDCTLLRYDQTLSPENDAAIGAMAELGVHFVISSGRTYEEILPNLREHPMIPYVIYSNGAVIYDRRTGTRHNTCFSGAMKKLVLDTLFSCDSCPSIHYHGSGYSDSRQMTPEYFDFCRVPPYSRKVFALGHTVSRDFAGFCYAMEEIEMIAVYFHRDEDLLRCEKIFLDTGLLEVTRSLPNGFEVFHKDAGKGNALLKLAQLLGCPREQTIAIGDSPNDSTMILAAGLGLATANAAPALKEMADAVICSNEEHVAQYVLEHYL